MSSSFEKQVKKVDQLIIHGELKEAYRMINESLKNKKISIVEELHFLTFKSELEYYFGNLDESIRLAELVLKKNKGPDNLLLSVDAYTWKACSSFLNGETNESLEAFEKGLTIISDVKNFPAKIVAKHKAQLMSYQAIIIRQLGDFNRGLEIATKALSLAEKSDYKNVICLNLIALAECHNKLGESERCRIYLEKALALTTELGNKFLIAFYYVMASRGHNWIREFETVEELFQKGFSLAEDVGSKSLFTFKNDLGKLYEINFRFDKALKYYHEAIKAAPVMKWITYANIGDTYYYKYDLEKAQEFYLKSMRYCEEINDRYILPSSLYGLVVVAVELNNLVQAKEHLNRLRELYEETGFERIDHIYRYASILIMKASGNMSDLVKAAELLNDFLAEERYGVIGRLSILYSLLEIRLKELQFSPNEDTLKEVQKRLHHLEVEAEEQQLRRFLADVYRLQSQLALVELDVKKAIAFLDKAQVIAEEIDVELSKKEIKRDREKIDQQLTMFQKFQEQQTPISETVKLVSLEKTVQNIKQETVLEERDQETGEIIEYRKLFALKI